MQQRLAASALDSVCSEMMVKNNSKDIIWLRKSYKGQGDKWNDDRMKRLDFINKKLREKKKKMKQGHISTMLMKQSLSTIEYLQNK